VIIVGGRRLYGKVEQIGSTYIATTFTFLQFLPLFPVKSHIVLGEGSSGTHDVVDIKLHGKSVAAGYLRAYGIAATLLSFIPGLVMAGTSETQTALAGAGTVLFCAGMTTAAFSFIGRPDRAEKARRLVYARFAAHPVDPAVFDEDTRGRIARRLREMLEERATTVIMGGGYRQGVSTKAGYRAVALESSMRDREFLEGALTLARIDASLSVGAMKADAMRVHDAIWNKLVMEHPDVLEVVRDAEVAQSSRIGRSLGFIPLVAALAVMGFMLVRNTHVFRFSPKSTSEQKEYGFVPEELLR